MKKTRYYNATIISMDPQKPYVENGFLEVENGRITAMGEGGAADDKACDSVDLKGKLVMPGLVSSHCHFYGQFVRGMPLKEPLENWQHVLSRMWWKVDRILDEKQVYYSTLLGLIDGLKAGTTTYFDHHVSDAYISGSLDTIAKGVQEAGARACLCYEVSDRYGADGAQKAIEENKRFARENSKNPQFRGLMGMHAGYTLEEDTLAACVQAANAEGIACHVHVAEAMADVCHSYKNYDMHVAQRMQEAGVLVEGAILAHGVHLQEKHWKMIAKSGATVAHNCQSNMNNAVGIAPVVGMLGNDVNVAIGGDGYTYDLLKELSIAAIAQRAFNSDTSLLGTEELLRLGFYNNTTLAKQTFGLPLGRLEVDGQADFVVLDYMAPTPMNENNYLSHVMCCGPQNVKTVVVDGNIVVENGHCTKLDEEAVLYECKQQAQRLWNAL